MTEGGAYEDLGGQVANESQRDIGKRRVAELRQVLDETVCDRCGHGNRYHDEVCHYPVGKAQVDCECPGQRKDVR